METGFCSKVLGCRAGQNYSCWVTVCRLFGMKFGRFHEGKPPWWERDTTSRIVFAGLVWNQTHNASAVAPGENNPHGLGACAPPTQDMHEGNFELILEAKDELGCKDGSGLCKGSNWLMNLWGSKNYGFWRTNALHAMQVQYHLSKGISSCAKEGYQLAAVYYIKNIF